MNLPNESSIDAPRASHGPSSRRLSSKEIEQLINRLADDSEVQFHEADEPFSGDESEDSAETVEDFLE